MTFSEFFSNIPKIFLDGMYYLTTPDHLFTEPSCRLNSILNFLKHINWRKVTLDASKFETIL